MTMKTPALHQAIRLYKYPKEMEWLTFPESELPEGVTDLLRLCASKKKLQDFSELFKIKEPLLRKVMLHFIEEVLLTTTNPDHKYIGLNHNNDDAKRKLHYQLLMKIYHPDKNPSESAADKASKITTAYKKLNQVIVETPKHNKRRFRDASDPRVPPDSFYRATQKAEHSLAQTRKSFYAAASLAFITLSVASLYLIQSSKTEFLVKNDQSSSPVIPSLTLRTNSLPSATLRPQLTSNTNIDDMIPRLEILMHDLERSYELGDVENIQPILSNTPEISGQSSEQVKAKLKTLFEITQERKMVLYNFTWANIAGNIQGEGKFLSRYKFNNEDQWLTREGIALISANPINNDLEITSLQLNNNNIEQ